MSVKSHLKDVLQEKWDNPRKPELKDLVSEQNGKHTEELKHMDTP